MNKSTTLHAQNNETFRSTARRWTGRTGVTAVQKRGSLRRTQRRHGEIRSRREHVRSSSAVYLDTPRHDVGAVG